MIQELFRVLNSPEVQGSQTVEAPFCWFHFVGYSPEGARKQGDRVEVWLDHHPHRGVDKGPTMIFLQGNQDAEA